jgi:hypothetical protein
VPAGGQRWTTLTELRGEGHSLALQPLEDGLTAVELTPSFGIGQRALHIGTPKGGVLWDCVGYFDSGIVPALNELGGVSAIAVSHPHFYGAMVEWAQAFGAQVWLPEADRAWVQRHDPAIRWWADEHALNDTVRVIQCGGHFDGSAVLHWDGADGAGVLLVGDTATIVADRAHFSFMRSYPNLLPLPAATVRDIVARASRYPFARAYGAWTDRQITSGAQVELLSSAERFIRWSTSA